MVAIQEMEERISFRSSGLLVSYVVAILQNILKLRCNGMRTILVTGKLLAKIIL